MSGFLIVVGIASQRLTLTRDSAELMRISVSTARNGPGETTDSFCTPRGRHVIRARIGAGAPLNAVFSGRRQTGEIFDENLRKQHPERDWILTRILWLSGLERGRNRCGNVDTMRRYVYIHGAPDADPMGTPDSHGCIKMRNQDVIKLFDMVPVGAEVDIRENE